MLRKCPCCDAGLTPIDLFFKPGLIGKIGPVICKKCNHKISEKLTEIPQLAVLPSLAVPQGLWGNEAFNWIFNTQLNLSISENYFIFFHIASILLTLLLVYFAFPLFCDKNQTPTYPVSGVK